MWFLTATTPVSHAIVENQLSSTESVAVNPKQNVELASTSKEILENTQQSVESDRKFFQNYVNDLFSVNFFLN